MKKTKFRNIGPVSEVWLTSIGVMTLKDLEDMGAEKAYLEIQKKGYRPTKNLLYALIGAIYDEDWKVVADTMKKK